MTLEVAFEFDTVHGHCVGIRLPPWDVGFGHEVREHLHPEEWDAAAVMKPRRSVTWLGGRLALRKTLAHLGVETGPIFSSDRGAPALPAGVAGSISHKESLAVALAVRHPRATVGVDVEEVTSGTLDIGRHVLTARELEQLHALAEPDRRAELLLRFSAKEAIYKALDPLMGRYIGFHEVEVEPQPVGGMKVGLWLKTPAPPRSIDVRWQRLGSVLLTTAQTLPQDAC